MKAEFKRTLTVTKNEQDIIEKFMAVGEILGLDFEETPEDLFEIMHAIRTENSQAYLYCGRGTIEIKYQDD